MTEEQEETSGGEGEGGEDSSTNIWQRGPARLPDRPIPPVLRPLIKPEGKR